MTPIYVALAGFIAWIVSTLGGGGGALLLVPAVSYLVGARAVAPVVTPVHAQDWQSVRRVFGKQGSVDEGVLRPTFPRTDLGLVMRGIRAALERMNLRANSFAGR